MTIQDFLIDLKNKPKFYVMFCPDAELRPIYIQKFVDVHRGKPVYRDSIDIGKQPRQIGPKPVYIVIDWEPGLKKPHSRYMNTNYPILLVYTKKTEPTEAVKEAYKNHIVVIPEVTGEQATNLLRKQGIPEPLIDFLKDKTDSTQEAILLGKQCVNLANELNLPIQNCFDIYYRTALQGRNIDEEPTEFLESILKKQFTQVFEYLLSQRGNELFVYAALLNWIEDIIKFCSCNGDYWNDAGLVAAKYKPFKLYGIHRIPFVKFIRLYGIGLKGMQSIKINESDPGTALEVFVCRIIQILA